MPTKHLFLELPYYSLPHSSYQPILLYKPTRFSFKLIFLKQRNRERVRGLDKLATCHVGPSPSWSQWGIVLADHNSRVEREKVVFFFFLMQVAISKFTLFEVPGCSSQFFFIQKIFQKENLNYYSSKSIMRYLNVSIWIPMYVCCGSWKKIISSLNSLFLFPLLK